jgi:WD40 repeat protein
MKLWFTTTGQCLRTLAGHSAKIDSCSFSPSGHEVYSASQDGNLVMWTAATGQLDAIIDTGYYSMLINEPLSVRASSDGKCIVSGHANGTVKAWRTGRGGLMD